jgi:hypothetical protein
MIKSLFRAILLLSSLAVLSTPAEAAKKAKVDFSEFEGRYQGTWLITAGTQSFAAGITGEVSSNKAGEKMRVDLSGILVSGSQSVPILTSIRFDNKRRVTTDSILLGFNGPSPAIVSKFSGKNGTFKFIISAAPGAMLATSDITGTTLNCTLKIKKRKLQIVALGSLVQGGTGTPIQIIVTLNKRRD